MMIVMPHYSLFVQHAADHKKIGMTDWIRELLP
ncbi:MAG: hypothetical protein GFH27_549333n112 [Chloroflexi bacterium AL-W]|nr:hypothetical protein [Chloroflexi bacterium AL-N1]NOK70435.1 hypothetical protein [Chloroflexi bacterium AL-N10]NOK78206.1 hypothetical protein [Chloroflexi bacterium AL-N5]NOK85305.1 hypothetical protein [Chloroflexi bacterium AL-W]NOK92070.1 hypothetical protein [Chloroflexi bacterium AL-N15]